MQSPKWLSYVTILFSLSILLPGLFLVFSPPATILGIYSNFGLSGISAGAVSALVNLFISLQARNIVIAAAMIGVSFRDMRVVLFLWGLRLLVEVADLIIALAQGSTGAGLLPVIGGFIVIELLVLGFGYRAYQRRLAAAGHVRYGAADQAGALNS